MYDETNSIFECDIYSRCHSLCNQYFSNETFTPVDNDEVREHCLTDKQVVNYECEKEDITDNCEEDDNKGDSGFGENNKRSIDFEQYYKVNGIIIDVDEQNKEFTMQSWDSYDCNVKRIVVSFKIVNKREYSRIVKGARVILVHGKLCKMGTQYNKTVLYIRKSKSYGKRELYKKRKEIDELFDGID